jgi:hypothetical protein
MSNMFAQNQYTSLCIGLFLTFPTFISTADQEQAYVNKSNFIISLADRNVLLQKDDNRTYSIL